MTTQRRSPSGQGPARRPASRVQNTRNVRVTGSVSRTAGAKSRTTTGVSRAARANRPAPTRRTVNVGPGTTSRTVAPRPRALTGRAAVLIVVLIALALAYTYPLRVYLAQESEIAQLEAAQADTRAQIAETSQELEKWKDPEYLRAQAREKLFYVSPGVTPLLVLEDPAGAAAEAGKTPPAAAPDRWYDTLWSSVRAADAESPD